MGAMSRDPLKPHGRDCPSRCSQCLGVPARVVTTEGPVLLVDGKPERTVDADDEQRRYYSRRGGKR